MKKIGDKKQELRATYAGFTDYLFVRRGVLKITIIPSVIYPISVLVMLLVGEFLANYWFTATASPTLTSWVIKVVIPIALPYLVLWTISQERRRRLYSGLPELLDDTPALGKLIPWSEVSSIRIGYLGLFTVSTPKKVFRMWTSKRTRKSIVEFAESAAGRTLVILS